MRDKCDTIRINVINDRAPRFGIEDDRYMISFTVNVPRLSDRLPLVGTARGSEPLPLNATWRL